MRSSRGWEHLKGSVKIPVSSVASLSGAETANLGLLEENLEHSHKIENSGV
jgi:hypothetical protein